jgi:hypothetical protein
LQAIEAAFAQAGVSANTFERFAVRLTTTIAEQWPEIAENIRSAANEQEQAQERMVAANLRVQAANNALADNAVDTSLRLEAANNKVEQSYIELAFRLSEGELPRWSTTSRVPQARRSVSKPPNRRLAALQGRPPSAADKQALAIKEAQLAVDKARQAQEGCVPRPAAASGRDHTEAPADRAGIRRGGPEAPQRGRGGDAPAAAT